MHRDLCWAIMLIIMSTWSSQLPAQLLPLLGHGWCSTGGWSKRDSGRANLAAKRDKKEVPATGVRRACSVHVTGDHCAGDRGEFWRLPWTATRLSSPQEFSGGVVSGISLACRGFNLPKIAWHWRHRSASYTDVTAHHYPSLILWLYSQFNCTPRIGGSKLAEQ